jgi:HlyD family secretion protein
MAKQKKKNRTLIIVLVLAAVILAALAYMKAKQKPRGEQVEFVEVEKRTIRETVSASGKVFPTKEVKISSDVSGEVVELLIEEGDSVQAGQVLARIDPDAYQSAVERGVAGLNTSKSEMARSKASVENFIAQLEQINAQLRNAKNIHARNEKLKEEGVISELDYEASLTNVQQLEANKRVAEASKRSAEQSVESARYNVKSTEATLKELRTSLNRTTIKSPTSGIVSVLAIEQGERVVGTIQMTGTEMMRIADFNSMEVQVEVSENDILRVALGDTAEIEVDAYLEEKFKGVVTEIASSATNTSVGGQVALTSDQVTNFVVKIRILPESYEHLITDNTSIPLRPGMSAAVDINTHTDFDVISIPIQAVTTREKDAKKGKEIDRSELDDDELLEVVFLYTDADTAKMVEVNTGIQDNEFIQILEGLEEGDKVISGPFSAISRKLKDGMQLREKEKKEDETEEQQ